MFNGMLKIALKLLVNDRGKFFTLIVGLTFAVFLMTQMTSTFSGIMQRASADIINIGAPIWVMDPSVNIERDNVPLPSYMLDVVKSIPGVQYAVPIFISNGLVKLNTGRYQAATVIGLDDTTLLGRPRMLEGDIHTIYNDDAYLITKDSDYDKMDRPKIGATFEINDHRGVIVGIGEFTVGGGLFGIPTLYTTYSRAIQTLPTTRFTTTYVLAKPKRPQDIAHIKHVIAKSGYVALTNEEFIKKNTDYYLYKTGLGTNIFIMTIISFIVGLSIAGQTFYAFVLENVEEFGALKAIGAKKNELMRMIFFQAGVVGFLGYGFGVLLCSAMIALARYRLPNFASMITYQSLAFSFVMVLIIIAFASYLGIRKVTQIDPFDIFRG